MEFENLNFFKSDQTPGLKILHHNQVIKCITSFENVTPICSAYKWLGLLFHERKKNTTKQQSAFLIFQSDNKRNIVYKQSESKRSPSHRKSRKCKMSKSLRIFLFWLKKNSLNPQLYEATKQIISIVEPSNLQSITIRKVKQRSLLMCKWISIWTVSRGVEL